MHVRDGQGQRLDNLAFFSVPWRFCNCYGFFLVFEIINFRQINSTQLRLKTDQVHVEDPVQKTQAAPNRLEEANSWSCIFQQCHPHRLDGRCLSRKQRII